MQRYFSFGPYLHIAAYNLFIGTGIALAMTLLQYDKQYLQYNEDKRYRIQLALVTAIIGGFICAYIFDGITQASDFKPSDTGLTLLGGLIPAIIILTVFFRVYKFPVIKTLNVLTPYCALAHAMGRVGCFFAGCCFGKPTNSIFGVVFPKGSLPYSYYHGAVSIHPTQLYEAVLVFMAFLYMRIYKPHNNFYFYLVYYAIARFVIEFFRADNRGTLFGQSVLSPSQVITLGMLPLVGLLWLRQSRAQKKAAFNR